jgi:hypothetical protein
MEKSGLPVNDFTAHGRLTALQIDLRPGWAWTGAAAPFRTVNCRHSYGAFGVSRTALP